MGVCLVTGGAGFLGSHVVESLARGGHVVRVLDNFTSGSLANLAEVIDEVELHPGDLSDTAFLARAMRGVELVFHFGGDPAGRDDPSSRASGIARGTLHVLYAALEARVRRVLVASSLEVYGPFRTRPLEEADLTEPLSPQGRALLSSELACAICTKTSGLETVRLRYFNVFGPRQPADSPFASSARQAVTAMSAGRRPVFEGDIDAGQDLIYVEDAVHATLLAARAPRVSGKAYNIGRGQSATCQNLVGTINSLLGTTIEPIYTGKQVRGTLDNIADIRRAEVELGFCAAIDLRCALARYVDAQPGGSPGSTQNTLPERRISNTKAPAWVERKGPIATRPSAVKEEGLADETAVLVTVDAVGYLYPGILPRNAALESPGNRVARRTTAEASRPKRIQPRGRREPTGLNAAPAPRQADA